VAILSIVVWPAAAVIFGFVLVIVLLPQLRALIARISRVKGLGVEATAEQAVSAQTAVAATSTTGAPTGPHPFEAGDNPYVLGEAERLRAVVGGMKFVGGAEERDRWIFREGAKLSIALDFEQIYRVVFGSQMEVLGRANRPTGQSVVGTQQLYDAVAQAAPQTYNAYTYDAWRGFIEGHGLVMQVGDKVFTTDKGRLFINYLVTMRYELHGQHKNL